jgi:hypothetical protein
MCPLELELTLAPASYFADQTTNAGAFSYSQNYSLSDLPVIYDEIMPDESIVNNFYKGLLSNQIMSVPILTAYQFSKPIDTGSTAIDVTASRAFSKISSIWVLGYH